MDLPSHIYIVQTGKSRKFRDFKRQIYSSSTHQLGRVQFEVKHLKNFRITQ